MTRLFANAGIAKYAILGKITEELYDSIFDINVERPAVQRAKALPLCRRRPITLPRPS